ncbi:MAG: hypothetical protein HEQ17_04345 [Limnohabitans sp.]|nr:hypothetical protein [Limnohabitans sp.]MCO4088201.1 hypothetical protein [Limnohabitans sp.]
MSPTPGFEHETPRKSRGLTRPVSSTLMPCPCKCAMACQNSALYALIW